MGYSYAALQNRFLSFLTTHSFMYLIEKYFFVKACTAIAVINTARTAKRALYATRTAVAIKSRFAVARMPTMFSARQLQVKILFFFQKL
jgi:hypothetical protein